MNAHQSQKELERLLADKGTALHQVTVADAFAVTFSFYRDHRAQDCSDKDSDMLLYQWGTYDWGAGKYFELNLTRQFIIGRSDDENIWQLSLTFKYSPTEELAALESGNKWCSTPKPQAMDYIEKYVRDSAPYKAVEGSSPSKVELIYFNAG